MERKSVLITRINKKLNLNNLKETLKNNYYIQYTCDGGYAEGVACFSGIKDNIKNLNIHILKDSCFYSKKFIIRYLKFLKECDVFCKIDLNVEEDDKFFTIKLSEGINRMHYLATATVLRYLWENNYDNFTLIPYYSLYIKKNFKLDNLKCLHIAHFNQYHKFWHNNHCIIDYRLSDITSKKDILNNLKVGISIHRSFNKSNEKGINFPIFYNEEDLKQKITNKEWNII